MKKGVKITFSIRNLLLPPPENNPVHSTHISKVISNTLSFVYDEKFGRINAANIIYATVVLTFLQRSSRIHMFFFYDSPKGKIESSVVIQRVI